MAMLSNDVCKIDPPQGVPASPSGSYGSSPSPPDVPSAAYLAAIRSNVPHLSCRYCGESIGAARLTLHPDAQTCAWCAPRQTQIAPRTSPAAMSANGSSIRIASA